MIKRVYDLKACIYVYCAISSEYLHVTLFGILRVHVIYVRSTLNFRAMDIDNGRLCLWQHNSMWYRNNYLKASV